MAKEQFTIARRPGWASMGEIKVEIECDPTTLLPIKLGLAVRAAFKRGDALRGADLTGADLTDAVLTRAVLTDAVLTRADLTRAVLTRAVLTDAVLTRADLTDAVLTGADLTDAVLTRAVLTDAVLTGADLTGADLTGADLTDAVLTDADLTRAVLTRAVLTGAVLTGAVLTGAVLRSFKADLWMTLTQNAHEVPGLIGALRAGKIDGSHYEGRCACLVGTIAKVKRVSYETLDHDAGNPAERWFMMIHEGDTPGKLGDDSKETGGGFAARLALEWCLEWCAALGVDPNGAAAAKPKRAPRKAAA